MTRELGQFQDDFIRAIYGEPDQSADTGGLSAAVSELMQQPAMKVYRNTIIKACIDALMANYPTVERLVGTEWFQAAAAIHVRQSRPANASLMSYGQDFPEFLARFEPARGLPYLADVARLDQDWLRSHTAADEVSMDAAALAGMAPETLGDLVLRPLASACWRWFDKLPVYFIWSVNRAGETLANDLEWTGQGALLLRQDGVVAWQVLQQGGCAFLDACALGLPLGQAAGMALQAQPDIDIARLLSELLRAGVFTAPHPSH